jgi:hypothetical protein
MSDIFQAAREGDLARVKELLAQGGLDLAAFEALWIQVTALYLAAYHSHLDVAEALIRAGAPLNVRKRKAPRCTALWMPLTTTWPPCCCAKVLR